MSLQWALNRAVPEDTAALGQVILRPDNIYRQLGDRFNDLFPEESVFAPLYEETGRGAIAPLLTSLVTVFQMMEKVPDRLAADYVISRIDWKYALHLPLTYTGFHFTDLYAFRVRLYEHQEERLVFDQLLAKLNALGLIKARGKARTDSTHLLAVVQRLTQLELVRECLRVAVRAAVVTAAAWVENSLPSAFCETYQVRQSEFGLSDEEVKERLAHVRKDAFWFLAQVDRSAPQEVRELEEVKVLRTVLSQQFPQGADGPAAKRPNGQDVIESPHEREARYATKRGQGWIGYKVQVTESCDDDQPHLILDLKVSGALDNDSPQLLAIQSRLEAQDTSPGEHFVDQGYMSGPNLVKSELRGIELVGIPLEDTQGPPGFQQSDFQIDEAAQQAICPAGQKNQVWAERSCPNEEDSPPAIQVRFPGAVCRQCPSFGTCTTSPQGRSLTLHPYRAALWAQREKAKTPEFQVRLHRRSGIEATISELVRGYDLRFARYRGQTKTQLQAYFTAIAANLKRVIRWWNKKTTAARLSLSYC